MVKKLVIIIAIILFVSINIFFSLYVERKNYKKNYKGSHTPQHLKKNTLTTIMPKQHKTLGQDLYLFKDYLMQNFEEEYGQENYYFFDLDNPSLNENDNNYCKKIFEKFVFCLSEENFKNIKNSRCNKLFEKEMEELEKCTFDFNFDFDITDYSKKLEENILYLNFSNYGSDKNDNEGENDFETQEIIFENKEKDITINEKKKYIMNLEDYNIKDETNQNKDCIEYGLSNDELLICTKFE